MQSMLVYPAGAFFLYIKASSSHTFTHHRHVGRFSYNKQSIGEHISRHNSYVKTVQCFA